MKKKVGFINRDHIAGHDKFHVLREPRIQLIVNVNSSRKHSLGTSRSLGNITISRAVKMLRGFSVTTLLNRDLRHPRLLIYLGNISTMYHQFLHAAPILYVTV